MRKNYFFSLCLVILLIVAATAVVSAKAEYTLRAAYVTPEGSQYDFIMQNFKERVERRTGGKVKIQLIPGGAAGSEKDTAEQLQLGALDMALNDLPSFIEPRLDLLTVPFVYDNIDHVYECAAGLVGSEMRGWMEERDIVVLDFYTRLGTAVASKVAIREPEDWKGVKIRTSKTEPLLDFYKALGAAPTPLAYGEVYTALKTGVVDGMRTLLDLIYEDGFHEPTDYLIVTGDATSPCFLQMSKRVFDKLPEDIQLILFQTAAEVRYINHKWVEDKWDYYINKLEEVGLEVIYYDSEKAKEAVKELPGEYADQYDAHGILELIQVVK